MGIQVDNGRLKIENYKDILYCEAYPNTEYIIDAV